MHQAIVRATRDCDFDQLERLAVAGRPRFDFSFTGDKRPASLWRQREGRGEKFAARLIRLLRMTPKREGQTYVWPAAFARNADDRDWEALVPTFGQNQVKIFRDYGGYTDLRLGITSDGDWIFCVDGD